MKNLSSLVSRLSSLKVTCILLVAFMLLTFWGVLGQAAAGNEGAADATDRFFNSYFLWAAGVIPLPAMKSLALVSALHLIFSLIFRMPKVCGRSRGFAGGGWRNLGLWGMHIALIFLLVGGVVGSELRREYNGYRGSSVTSGVAGIETAGIADSVPSGAAGANPSGVAPISFFEVTDSLDTHLVQLPEGYPYFVFYKGQVDMFGMQVEMYSATYDPLKFVPYVFSVLFLLSAAFHYCAKCGKKRRSHHCAKRGTGRDAVLNSGRGAVQDSGRGVVQDSGHAASRLQTSGSTLVLLIAAAGIFAIPSYCAESEEHEILWLGTNPDDPVLVGDDIRPYDSFARGILNEFSGRTSYKFREEDLAEGKIPAYQVVEDIVHAPRFAEKYALFKVLRSDVSEALELPPQERYVSYESLQRNRGKLEIYASRKDEHPATLEMQRLLQNVHLYEAIARGELPKFISYSEQLEKTGKMMSGHKFAAEEYARAHGVQIDYSRLNAETFYNKVNFALVAFILAFFGCVLAAVNVAFKKRLLDIAANVSAGATAAVLTVAFAMRLYISARPPLSSLYEIVLLVALMLEAFEFGAFLFCKRRTFSLIVPVTLMAAILLFFAKFILEPGDLFQPIPAVLNSSAFLTMHVFTIALGFAGVILSGVVAHVALFRPTPARMQLLYGTLIFGSCFTILGTLLGGVWADFAWGRFWGFDPKECGAFFVILWTMLGLHLHRARVVSERGFALFNAFNVIVTFLCWFGINLLGVGLHSYGFQSGTLLWLAILIALDSALIAFFAKMTRPAI